MPNLQVTVQTLLNKNKSLNNKLARNPVTATTQGSKPKAINKAPTLQFDIGLKKDKVNLNSQSLLNSCFPPKNSSATNETRNTTQEKKAQFFMTLQVV